jgi:predicted HTH domain antitoxin
MDIEVKIPDEALRLENGETARRVLEAVALSGYKSGQLTIPQIRRILGFETRLEVYDFLAENGIAWVDYPVEDAERERKLLQNLLP